LGREAFTLIEMIVVIGIMLTLATMTVAFLPKVNNYQKVQQAASRVQGWLLTAKQRALRDRQPRGVRIIPDPVDSTISRSLQYIEQPDDFTGGTLTAADSLNGPNLATISNPPDLAGGLDPAGTHDNPLLWPVQPGDYLQMNPTSTQPVFAIQGVQSVNETPLSNVLQTLPTAPLYTAPATGITSTNYRIIRRPRPMVGEAALLLPQDVVLDVSGTPNKSSVINPEQITLSIVNYDILFAPSGAVMRAGAQAGKIILWFRDATQDATAPGEQFLVVVYTRTGLIAVHPVADPATPFAFTKDGKDSGL
jgi:prepilin-type N-terminal cleavage/methylation domain-containing protein